MRVAFTLVVAVLLSASAAAQLPRPADLADLVRKAPSLDRFMKNRPLDSSIDDAPGPQKFLDQREAAINRQPGDMKRLPRTSIGGFVLRPGLWEGTFESYCLRPATRGPSGAQSDGYLWAPLKGPRANAISIILRAASAHPNVPQGDIQMLLWAILARTRVSEMPPTLQAAARVLLPASELNAISVDGLQVINIADRTNLFRSVTGPMRQVLEIESDLRYEFSKGNANYEQIEKLAVLSGGAPPRPSKNAVNRGQWSRHPGGYWVRYFPDSFRNMKLQVLVPGQVKVVRDRLHRIISIEDSRGKTETTYNDAIKPRPHPRNSRMQAYAFKTIRITRRGPDGKPVVLELKDKGWTFHQSRPPRRAMADLLADGARWVMNLVSGTPVEARQGWDWDGWVERAQNAYEHWQDYEWLRDRAEATTTTGDDSAVDDLGDTEHYNDGIEAALEGNVSDRLQWLAEHQERENEALEHAVWVIDTLPTTSTTEDGPPPRDWDFGGGAGHPSSTIDQILGTSSR